MSKSRQNESSRRLRRIVLAALLIPASGCATGESSLTSLNPFAATPPEAPAGSTANSPAGGITSSVSGLVQGSRNQASSMGMTLKSAYGKSRDAVSGMFGGASTTAQTDNGESVADNDPLLLQNKPASIGPEVFVANGQLWESTGNFERAMENYSKALESHPENAPALASIARLHYRQHRYEQAETYFQRAIDAEPAEAGLYNDLGLTLSKLERHDEAVTAVGKALAIAPGTTRYATNLATVQFAAGREDNARATLLKNNKPAVAHYNMAYLYYNSQRTDQALEELGKVLAMGRPTDGDSASKRAFDKSKELFDQLGGPATQIAQALPQLYGAFSGTGKAASTPQGAPEQDAPDGVTASLRNTSSGGVTVRLSGGEDDGATATKQAAAQAASKPSAASKPPAAAEPSAAAASPQAAKPAPSPQQPAPATAEAAATTAAPPAEATQVEAPPAAAEADGSAASSEPAASAPTASEPTATGPGDSGSAFQVPPGLIAPSADSAAPAGESSSSEALPEK